MKKLVFIQFLKDYNIGVTLVNIIFLSKENWYLVDNYIICVAK